MSIRTQASIRWFAAATIIVILSLTRRTSTGFELPLWITLLVLIASAFLWPRCPHCKARVVQINKREWIPGRFCWRCRRPYDEIETPAYEADLSEVADKAYKLRKKDPATAHRLLEETEQRMEAAATAEKASLRQRAQDDLVAARTLRNRLRDELRRLALTRKALEKASRTDPTAETGLRNISVLEQSAQQEIAALDAVLSRTT